MQGRIMSTAIDLISRDDIPAIVEIWNDSFPEASLSPKVFQRQLFKEFAFDIKGCFVARKKSEIVGFSLATTFQIPYTSRRELPGCIPAIAVKKENRAEGIGTDLLQKAEEYLRLQGAKKIRLGYPTYLRGTLLSLIGVDTQWNGAIRFFETFGYAPKGVLDSMGITLGEWEMPAAVVRKLRIAQQNGIEFPILRNEDTAEFREFLNQDFPGSWNAQFDYLYKLGLLVPEEVLVMKEKGKIAGFAGPFHISERGDTCGIGLGITPRLRGKGLGLLLLFNIVKMVQENGGKRLILFGAVDKVNYYGKAGFSPSSIWLIMEKCL